MNGCAYSKYMRVTPSQYASSSRRFVRTDRWMFAYARLNGSYVRAFRIGDGSSDDRRVHLVPNLRFFRRSRT